MYNKIFLTLLISWFCLTTKLFPSFALHSPDFKQRGLTYFQASDAKLVNRKMIETNRSPRLQPALQEINIADKSRTGGSCAAQMSHELQQQRLIYAGLMERLPLMGVG